MRGGRTFRTDKASRPIALLVDAARARHMGGMKAMRSTGLVIDEDGREIRPDQRLASGNWNSGGSRSQSRSGFQGRMGGEGISFEHLSFDSLGIGGGPLSREQRIARLDALAKLLDVAFVVPGTKIRYGIDGLIGLVPIVGDLITTAISLWIVREARALGAPWHITGRMLANVAVDGTVGLVPFAGDAFDVMFRANMRNVRMLRRWLERQDRRGKAEILR